tara:strand:+ start:282 stop:470 length:189 start_codon:yes stop_codon:yes gene_type:complete
MTKKGNKLNPLHYQIDQDVIDFIKYYNLNFNKEDLQKAADYLDREIKYTREIQKEWIENNKI